MLCGPGRGAGGTGLGDKAGVAAFDVLVERFAARVGATAEAALERLAAVALHVLAQVRAETAAHGAHAAAHHRRTACQSFFSHH